MTSHLIVLLYTAQSGGASCEHEGRKLPAWVQVYAAGSGMGRRHLLVNAASVGSFEGRPFGVLLACHASQSHARCVPRRRARRVQEAPKESF